MDQNVLKKQIHGVVTAWLKQYDSPKKRAVALESMVSGMSLIAAFLSSNDGGVTPQEITQAVQAFANEHGMKLGSLKR